jgi:hypothetical protein
MLNRLPTPAGLPPLPLMLADLGQPSARHLGRALGVTERTARRWVAAGHAPRPAMLALFWVTRWGHSAALCEAQHSAALARAYSAALADEKAALQADLSRVLALADTGAANVPTWRALPLAPVLPLRQEAKHAPRSA